MRSLELRRHAPKDPDADRLSADGQRLAEKVGRDLPGGYDAVFTSAAKRAAETAAWFLRGLGQQLPQQHGVVDGLGSELEDRWKAAAKAAGTGRVDRVWEEDPELVEQEAVRLGEVVRGILDDIPEDRRGLVVGHSPLLEAAVHAITGDVVEPLRECEGVLLVQDEGEVRLDRDFRLED